MFYRCLQWLMTTKACILTILQKALRHIPHKHSIHTKCVYVIVFTYCAWRHTHNTEWVAFDILSTKVTATCICIPLYKNKNPSFFYSESFHIVKLCKHGNIRYFHMFCLINMKLIWSIFFFYIMQFFLCQGKSVCNAAASGFFSVRI